jgi:hypothetical protein
MTFDNSIEIFGFFFGI